MSVQGEQQQSVLSCRDLRVSYRPQNYWGRPVREPLEVLCGVDLDLAAGELIGLCGSSGSGKSTLVATILGLLKPDAGKVTLLDRLINAPNLRRGRGDRLWQGQRLQVVFQDPASSLNPRFSAAAAVAEGLAIHRRPAQDEKIDHLLKLVDLDPARRFDPVWKFSGGQQQRLAIARAMALDASVLVLDEPTGALDPWHAERILALLAKLRDELGIAMLMVSHDFKLLRHFAAQVAILHTGQIVEAGPSAEVWGNPQHPHTQALIQASQ